MTFSTGCLQLFIFDFQDLNICLDMFIGIYTTWSFLSFVSCSLFCSLSLFLHIFSHYLFKYFFFPIWSIFSWRLYVGLTIWHCLQSLDVLFWVSFFHLFFFTHFNLHTFYCLTFRFVSFFLHLRASTDEPFKGILLFYYLLYMMHLQKKKKNSSIIVWPFLVISLSLLTFSLLSAVYSCCLHFSL